MDEEAQEAQDEEAEEPGRPRHARLVQRGSMKDRRAPRGGAHNEQRELLDDEEA